MHAEYNARYNAQNVHIIQLIHMVAELKLAVTVILVTESDRSQHSLSRLITLLTAGRARQYTYRTSLHNKNTRVAILTCTMAKEITLTLP